MRVVRLRLEGFRLFDCIEWSPAPGVNLILGPNGAGKTSLLEGLYLLAYGRSFRTAGREALLKRGAERLTVFAEVERPAGRVRLGLAGAGGSWEGRIDAAAAPTLSDLHAAFAMVCFEPGSHALIGGGSELRRRFLDWGLFHVEPEFLSGWRRYQRALRQRNALLKAGPAAQSLAAWDHELAEAGERLHHWRQGYAAALAPWLAHFAAALMPEAGPPELRYAAGWRSTHESLADALQRVGSRDLALGHATVGPHRANWTLTFPALPDRDSLSRGQEKLAALIALLAQAAHLAQCRNDWPVLALDDLASELDALHQQRALAVLQACPAQVLITGTARPAAPLPAESALFHVERGAVEGLV